ncbi:MAG: DUF3662 and FHA domain-containing protein [Coriobacteriia bacterium]
MSILSDFEDRIGNVVEGGFARVFRSPVQPAELARKLTREMDRRKVVGVGKVYAPTLYSVLLSPADDAQLGGFAETLAGELETYLVSEAREHSYALATRPVVRFLVDDDLKLGRFDVIGELLSPEEMAAELNEELPISSGGLPADSADSLASVPVVAPVVPVVKPNFLFDAEAEAGADAESPSDSSGEEVARASSADPERFAALATVTIRGLDRDVILRGNRMVVGRLASCDVCLADANTSRQHAAFVREGAGWVIDDLGSTNGTLVNGDRVESLRLRDGDVIVVGVTELVFHEPRQNA